jgi:hypothetical protein
LISRKNKNKFFLALLIFEKLNFHQISIETIC